VYRAIAANKRNTWIIIFFFMVLIAGWDLLPTSTSPVADQE